MTTKNVPIHPKTCQIVICPSPHSPKACFINSIIILLICCPGRPRTYNPISGTEQRSAYIPISPLDNFVQKIGFEPIRVCFRTVSALKHIPFNVSLSVGDFTPISDITLAFTSFATFAFKKL